MKKITVRKNKHNKTKKRKVSYNKNNSARKNMSIENTIIKRARYHAKNNILKVEDNTPIAEIVNETRNQLAQLLPYHYYLVFVQEMIEEGVLTFKQSEFYNVIKFTDRFKNINKEIDNAVLLEDESMANIHLIYICTWIQTLAEDVCKLIGKTESQSEVINKCIVSRSQRLKTVEEYKDATENELYNEVLRISAISHIVDKTKELNKKSETTQVETEA